MNQQQFLSHRKVEIKALDVPGFSEQVHIKKMSLGDRMNVMKQHKKDDMAELSLVVWCSGICDEQGKCLFRYPEDSSKLNSMDPAPMDYILSEIMDLNGLGKEAIDESEKN